MRIGTGEVIRKIDKYCIEVLKIPGIVLMENAAAKVVENINTSKFRSFVIVCGTGNNGGDGFAVGRQLFSQGCKIRFFLLGSPENMSALCRVNYEIIKSLIDEASAKNSYKNISFDTNNRLNVSIIYNERDDSEVEADNEVEVEVNAEVEAKEEADKDFEELREAVRNCDAVIDGIFGTGLVRELKGIYFEAVSIINSESKYTIAIDVPSGLDSDGGRVMGSCIDASKTITFLMFKKGFLNYNAEKFTGEVVVSNIGIPEFVLDKFNDKMYFTTRESVKANLKPREKFSHKGDFGRVAVIAGSEGFTGAAYLSSASAVRSGAGLVTLCCDESLQGVLSSKTEEAMTVSIQNENFHSVIKKSNSIAFGPGLGNNVASRVLLSRVLTLAACPVVIDADGLNVLQGNLGILKLAEFMLVLTPHPGEFSRLSGLTMEAIEKDRIKAATDFAKKHRIILLLKGYNTIITDGETVYVNPTGSSAMASGGMGDTLTGIIASFIGQGLKPFQAAFSAAYIHGYCGDRLAETRFSVNASELLRELPAAIKEVIE